MDTQEIYDNLEYEIEKMDKHRDKTVAEAHRLKDAGDRIANDARIAFMAEKCADFLKALKDGLPIKITAEQESILSDWFMEGAYEAIGQEIDEILTAEYRRINDDLDSLGSKLHRDYVNQNRTH